MAYWLPLDINGFAIDLSHLEPFEFTVLPKGGDTEATVSVRFHDHCFTETFDATKHSSVMTTGHASSHEQRSFSPTRYELSKRLPSIILELPQRRICWTRQGNLVRITTDDGKVYPVFFTLRRAGGGRLELFFVSAYEWTRQDKIAIRAK
ncbi:hypothetical protein [Rhizobium sp. G21]|uniref:hypothetical protein n=1 Tax=Rhizobium sp. G21 TaxID=2758439 RepID=UPI0015FFBD6C|nr:hypothetical protein [Rhizobium sp. G21]MBB1248605.1 hypothetical protein [Rhizobium sp. G21]